MALDILEFYQATEPSRTLAVEDPEDAKYYIDFSSVRGGDVVQVLKKKITFFSAGKPSCQLFAGHIGCGKSTELLRLKDQLQKENYQVVFFESSQDLEMSDVDVEEILLAIARRVIESLEHLQLGEPKGLKAIIQGVANLLQTDVELSVNAGIPGIAQITAKTKNSPEIRHRLREYLGQRTTSILEAINQELLEPAREKIKQQGNKELVVIIDNLDRIESVQKPWGITQPEYLFVDRGEQLRQLNCHVVYTIPLALVFSSNLSRAFQRFGVDPNVLPMVRVKLRDGRECTEGMVLLRRMVMTRAFPNVTPQEQEHLITEVFDLAETLDRLCRVSGGHVRELLRLLNEWIFTEQKFPLSREGLETVIRMRRNQMMLAMTDDAWQLLRQVQQRKYISGDDAYQLLVRNLLVYEYRDREESWFEVNPILAEVLLTAREEML